MNPTIVQSRDVSLLMILAVCVPFLSLLQVAGMWQTDRANVRRRLQKLSTRSWIELLKVWARSAPTIEGPLCTWRPGKRPPNFAQLSYRAKDRYRRKPLVQRTVVVPTVKTLEHFGLCGRRCLKQTQCSHSLGVAESFLFVRRRWPRLSQHWVGEQVFVSGRETGEKVEDALILHPRSQAPFCAVEFAGMYRKDRFEALHDDLSRRGCRYIVF